MKEIMKSKYDHKFVEANKNEFWKKNKTFTFHDKTKKPFSIIMPPPNITGKLHLGHSLDMAIQDLLIRYKKLQDFDVLYVPGIDHAGIATQSKFEKELLLKNINKYDLSKEEFLKKLWKWSSRYSKIIRTQWDKMGLGIDYSYELFTLSNYVKDKVEDVFIELYNKNKIYRSKKIVFLDVSLKTVISNIEVIYKNIEGEMYYFKYFLDNDKKQYLEVATTRPETMFADQALVVNPNDKRYQKYISKTVINPINNNKIKVIADEYVDIDYGTGIMKCTPGHDFNDFIIGKKHNLKMPICINIDGTLNELASKYCGLDRIVARKIIIKDLAKKNILTKIKKHLHKVGFSERTNTIVEPYLSKQWFLSMKSFAKEIIKIQTSKEKVNFYPLNFNNNLLKWMENIEDWCISRQLLWGHSLPVWYHKTIKEKIYVGKNPPFKDIKNYYKDLDVLDTWFSSALWPFLCFGWKKDNILFKRYFPSNVLVTGYDIIFFWVSRMMIQSFNFTNTKPFKHVVIHGLIRDKDGNKMSKSLGNGIDPMDIIAKHGCDTLRYFLLTNVSPGKDLKYNSLKIASSWNFINKLWNASRYVILNIPKDFKYNFNFKEESLLKINKWILNKLKIAFSKWKHNMNRYEFLLAGKTLYYFLWNEFCSVYIEFIKVNLKNKTVKVELINIMVFVLKEILKMLHPFIPFVTEDIYQKLNLKKSILDDKLKKLNFDFNCKYIDFTLEIITKIRDFKTMQKLNKIKDLNISINIFSNNSLIEEFRKDLVTINSFLNKIVNVSLKTINIGNINNKNSNLILLNCSNFIIEVIENEKIKQNNNLILQKELHFLDKEILRCNLLLSNEKFLKNAKKEKVILEQNKLKKYQANKGIILKKMKVK